MIKQATETEIEIIESILMNAVDWMDSNGLHQWERENVRWSHLSQFFVPGDFYIAYVNNVPAACMALIDHDPVFWPEVEKGESLYIHKIAVKREFSGKGISKELIDFAKEKALQLGVKSLRLDCHRHRYKVRTIYEKQGFVLVEERTLFGKYDTAFYVCVL